MLDDYQINGLLNPEVFNNPREVEVLELIKYKFNRERILTILGKVTPRIEGFKDTQLSEDSFGLLEQLHSQFPNTEIKSQFKSVQLTQEMVRSLLDCGRAFIARRILLLEQAPYLEEVSLHSLSAEAFIKLLPYLSRVKKLTLVDFNKQLALKASDTIVLPCLEKIKLLRTTIYSTDLVFIIKNAAQLKKLDIYLSAILDNGPLAPLSLPYWDTIKSKTGGISKRNFQDVLLQHKIKRVLFSHIDIIPNSLTEIKDHDLSSIKILEINQCTCDATYLNQMFELLPQLEHVSIRGGSIKRFSSTFSLASLKTLTIDLQRFNDLASAFDNLKIEKLTLIDQDSNDVPALEKLNLSKMSYWCLANNRLNPLFLVNVLKRTNSLKHLDLTGCTNLSNLVQPLLMPSVDTLTLSRTDISAASLGLFLEQAPNLKRLDLSGCNQLVLTAKLRSLLQRIQVYYPEHIKTERKKPDYALYAQQTDQRFSLNEDKLKRFLASIDADKMHESDVSLDPDQQKARLALSSQSHEAVLPKNKKATEGLQNQEPFLDADTKFNEIAEFNIKVTFFPLAKEEPIPAVTQYRENLFNALELTPTPCSIDRSFRLKHTGDLQLNPCTSQRCTNDVFSAVTELKPLPEYLYYYGKTSLQLTNEWQPLPSLSAQEELTHYHIEPHTAVELNYSSRDNQYYLRSKEASERSISVDYLIKVAKPRKTPPLAIQQVIEYFSGSLIEPGFSSGPLMMALEHPTGADYMNAILKQKKGSCRHRSVAFYYLMQEKFPTVLVRMMVNSCHMQVEILVEDEWITCNLGGYPAKLNVQNTNNPWHKEQVLLPHGDTNQALLKEDEQIAQHLQTWKKSKQPELALDDYCAQLTELRQQKKYLIETSHADSLHALTLALRSHCIQNNKPYFYIQKPDQITCSAPFLIRQGGIGFVNEGPGGVLHDFLTQAYDKLNPPILLINAEQFDPDDLVQHNSLFDDKPKADGVNLPEGTIVLLLVNSNKPNFNLGEDLTSRIDVIESCPVSDIVLSSAYPPLRPKSVDEESSERVTLDFFNSEHWESILLGQWTISGNHLYFEEGLLQAALKDGVRLTLKNGLWANSAFRNFWQEALHFGFIDYEGQRIELPKNCSIEVDEGYNWEQLKAVVEFKGGIDCDAPCINPNLFSALFSRYVCLDESNGLKKRHSQL